jgi:hypothetical protein
MLPLLFRKRKHVILRYSEGSCTDLQCHVALSFHPRSFAALQDDCLMVGSHQHRPNPLQRPHINLAR